MAPVTRRQASGDGTKARHKRASSWDILDSHGRFTKDNDLSRTLQPSIEADHDDAITPLRRMADRVGKEVEKFAERLDQWLGYGTTHAGTEGNPPGRMVAKFRDDARAISKPLRLRNYKEDTSARAAVAQRLISLREGLFEDVSVLENGSGESQDIHLSNLQRWEGEVDTWDLALLILAHRLSDPTATDDVAKQPQEIHRYSSRQDVWDQFLLHDKEAKEKELVLKWLRQAADRNGDNIDKLGEQFEKLGDGEQHGHSSWTHGWMATKERLKAEKRMGTLSSATTEGVQPNLWNSGKNGLLVTQLDPDAPSRQGRILEDSDEYQERFLWFVGYQLLRRGKSFPEIKSWMSERNESWRSVSFGITQDMGQHSSTSAAHSILWRRMCYAAANSSNGTYERAVYGLLGGDFTSVRPVCHTWEDHLYAHFNCVLTYRFDHYVRAKFSQTPELAAARRFPSFNSKGFYGNDLPINRSIMRILNAESDLKPSNLQKIQASLLTDSLDDLAYNVGAAIAKVASVDARGKELFFLPQQPVRGYESFVEDEQALRVLVHLYIAYCEWYPPGARSDTQVKTMENIFVWYIELLRSARKLDLLPLYAAQLSPNRKARTISHILPGITSEEEQKRLVRLMTRHGIDVEDILEKHFKSTLASCGLRPKMSLKDEPMVGYPDNNEIVPASTEFKILQTTTNRNWPGQKIRVGFLQEDIQPSERAVIEAARWFLHLKTWKLIFSSLEDALVRFLAYGRISVAYALTTHLNVSEISLEKSPHFLKGEAIDVTVWEADGGTESLNDSELEHSLRRPSLSRRRSPRVALDQPDEDLEVATTKKLLKQDSKVACDLQQLVLAIGTLHEWAGLEEDFISNHPQNTSSDKATLREVFTSLTEIMHPLLRTSTTVLYDLVEALHPHAGDPADLSSATTAAYAPVLQSRFTADIKRMEILQRFLPSILAIYVPELVLAYASTIQSASVLLGAPKHTTLTMELAALLADTEGEQVMQLFADGGRMRELVRVLAGTSRVMVGAGDKDRPRRREWEGETVKIWDMTVRN